MSRAIGLSDLLHNGESGKRFIEKRYGKQLVNSDHAVRSASNASLTPELVRIIRTRYANRKMTGETVEQIAEDLGTTKSTIGACGRYETYRWVS